MKAFIPGPRRVKMFDEDQLMVQGPEFDGGKRELIGTFTGDYKDGNALLDSVAPDLFEVLKTIVKSEEPPSSDVWEYAKSLIAHIEDA